MSQKNSKLRMLIHPRGKEKTLGRRTQGALEVLGMFGMGTGESGGGRLLDSDINSMLSDLERVGVKIVYQERADKPQGDGNSSGTVGVCMCSCDVVPCASSCTF